MFVRAGLRFENKKNNGISHFLEHMLFRGNRKYPDSISLNLEFEKIGRDLRASTLSEYTYYGFSPHYDQLERGMELFAEFFTDPTFPGIELERGIILEEYLEDLNAEGENIDINNVACDLMYENDPLALPTIGTEETIKSIDAVMLRDYFDQYYCTSNMVLVGAGCLAQSQFHELAQTYFGRIPSRGTAVPKDHFLNSVREDQTEPQLRIQEDVDSQDQVQICFRSISYNHPEYYAASLISRLFDDGVSSRLQKVLREEQGLAYSVECRATSLADIGTIDFDVSVRPEKVEAIVQVIFSEIKKFLDSGVTLEELNHVKKSMEDERPTIVNTVLPHIKTDYVSWSSYDVTTEAAKLGGEKGRQIVIDALNYIEKHLPESDIPGKRVFIGEYGFNLQQVADSEVQKDCSASIMQWCLEWGCPFVLYWELYCNEIDKTTGEHRGFWLIDKNGDKQPAWYLHRDFLQKANRFVRLFEKKNGRLPSQAEYNREAGSWLKESK